MVLLEKIMAKLPEYYYLAMLAFMPFVIKWNVGPHAPPETIAPISWDSVVYGIHLGAADTAAVLIWIVAILKYYYTKRAVPPAQDSEEH